MLSLFKNVGYISSLYMPASLVIDLRSRVSFSIVYLYWLVILGQVYCIQDNFESDLFIICV